MLQCMIDMTAYYILMFTVKWSRWYWTRGYCLQHTRLSISLLLMLVIRFVGRNILKIVFPKLHVKSAERICISLIGSIPYVHINTLNLQLFPDQNFLLLIPCVIVKDFLASNNWICTYARWKFQNCLTDLQYSEVKKYFTKKYQRPLGTGYNETVEMRVC